MTLLTLPILMGVFEALSSDLDRYAMSSDMSDMISGFRQRIELELFDNEHYSTLLQQDNRNRELRGVSSELDL